MPDDRTRIAERMRTAREYLGLSQQEVADAIGISRSAVSLLESGNRGVDSVELLALAKLYQRPVSYFLEDTEPASNEPALMLARKIASLSETDREEVLRFSEFLVQRAKGQSGK